MRQGCIMERLFTVTSTVLALLLAHTGFASAQARWGHSAAPHVGACFYKDSDFRGQYFCAGPGETLTSLPNGMGDEISSIRTFGNAHVIVFRDSGYRGRSEQFNGDIKNLKQRGWNDTISSIRIEGRGFVGGDHERPAYGTHQPQWGHGPMTRNGACFFEDSDFRGRYFCVYHGDSFASLPSGFNDRISSVRVFGNRGVEVFVNDDYHGRSTRITHDTANLGSHWGDTISSLKVF